MCDVCGDGEESGEWASEAGTVERMREVLKVRDDHIFECGHSVLGIFDDETGTRFFYSVGRSVYGNEEFLITGPLPPKVATFMINRIAQLVDSGEIKLDPTEVNEIETGVLLEGFPCRIVLVGDPRSAQMFQALNITPDLQAYQIIWPDLDGNWPDDLGYDERFAQPIHAIV